MDEQKLNKGLDKPKMGFYDFVRQQARGAKKAEKEYDSDPAKAKINYKESDIDLHLRQEET